MTCPISIYAAVLHIAYKAFRPPPYPLNPHHIEKGAGNADNKFSENLNRSQMELIDGNKIWNSS